MEAGRENPWMGMESRYMGSLHSTGQRLRCPIYRGCSTSPRGGVNGKDDWRGSRLLVAAHQVGHVVISADQYRTLVNDREHLRQLREKVAGERRGKRQPD